MGTTVPDMDTLTPTQRLAESLLGLPVLDWIATRRAAGLSWRRIAQILHSDTGGQVDVTPETLRTWLAEAHDEQVSA